MRLPWVLIGATVVSLSFGHEIEKRAPAGTLKILDAFNGASFDHFYTTDKNELDDFIARLGFKQEAKSTGYIYTTRQPGTTPLYRMYAVDLGDHLYTTSMQERDLAIRRRGYVSEGIMGYVYTSDGPGRVPFYCLHNPGQRDHFYTSSSKERDIATGSGYANKGVVGYLSS